MPPSSLPAACILPFSHGLPQLCLARPGGHTRCTGGAWGPPTGGPCMQSPVWQEEGKLRAWGSGGHWGQFGVSRKGN